MSGFPGFDKPEIIREQEHLEYLYETKSLKDKSAFDEMINEYSELNKMLFSFIESVEKMLNRYLKEIDIISL